MNITCRTCGQTKPDTEYYKKKKSVTGRETQCKDCKADACARRNNPNRDEPLGILKHCRNCGETTKRRGSTYCSKPECRKAFHMSPEQVARRKQWFKDNPDKVREYNHRNGVRRRRLMAEAKTDDVTWRGVMERDNWTCQLCGKPIDQTVKAPHRMSASLDHVVPLIEGGDHTWANTQASHFGCNARKRDRGEPQQLALI